MLSTHCYIVINRSLIEINVCGHLQNHSIHRKFLLFLNYLIVNLCFSWVSRVLTRGWNKVFNSRKCLNNFFIFLFFFKTAFYVVSCRLTTRQRIHFIQQRHVHGLLRARERVLQKCCSFLSCEANTVNEQKFVLHLCINC